MKKTSLAIMIIVKLKIVRMCEANVSVCQKIGDNESSHLFGMLLSLTYLVQYLSLMISETFLYLFFFILKCNLINSF